MSKVYNLFISHSLTYNLDACKKKIKFFEKANLEHTFLEAHPNNPEATGSTEKEYIKHIDQEIKKSDCILVLAGTTEEHNYWTTKEVELAKSNKKPIILVEPWLSARTMPILSEQADIIVKWNGKKISDAIRKFVS
jgi:hypothetical protein